MFRQFIPILLIILVSRILKQGKAEIKKSDKKEIGGNRRIDDRVPKKKKKKLFEVGFEVIGRTESELSKIEQESLGRSTQSGVHKSKSKKKKKSETVVSSQIKGVQTGSYEGYSMNKRDFETTDARLDDDQRVDSGHLGDIKVGDDMQIHSVDGSVKVTHEGLLFSTGTSEQRSMELARAVLYSEIIGKPVSMR